MKQKTNHGQTLNVPTSGPAPAPAPAFFLPYLVKIFSLSNININSSIIEWNALYGGCEGLKNMTIHGHASTQRVMTGNKRTQGFPMITLQSQVKKIHHNFDDRAKEPSPYFLSTRRHIFNTAATPTGSIVSPQSLHHKFVQITCYRFYHADENRAVVFERDR